MPAHNLAILLNMQLCIYIDVLCSLCIIQAPEPAPSFLIGDLEASSDEEEDDPMRGFIVDEQGRPVKLREAEGGARDG